jgi:hypothetical protein
MADYKTSHPARVAVVAAGAYEALELERESQMPRWLANAKKVPASRTFTVMRCMTVLKEFAAEKPANPSSVAAASRRSNIACCSRQQPLQSASPAHGPTSTTSSGGQGMISLPQPRRDHSHPHQSRLAPLDSDDTGPMVKTTMRVGHGWPVTSQDLSQLPKSDKARTRRASQADDVLRGFGCGGRI